MNNTFIHLLLAIVFAVFALLQYNDTEPLRWILFYSFVSLFVLWYDGKTAWMLWLKYAYLVICVLWFASFAPTLLQWFKEGMPSIVGTMKAATPYVQYVRESLGILLAGLTVLLIKPTRKI